MTECTEAESGTLDLVIRDSKGIPIPDLEYLILIEGKVASNGKTDSKGKGKTINDLKIGSKFEIYVKRKQGNLKKVAQGTANSKSCVANLKSPKTLVKVSTDVNEPVDSVPEVKTAKVAVFQLSDIPSTMKKMGWSTAAKVMERWFNNPAWVMSRDEKINSSGDLDLQRTPQQIDTTTVKMAWLLGFQRAEEARKKILEVLVPPNDVPLWRSSKALGEFEKRLKRGHKFTNEREKFGYHLDAVKLHHESFLNEIVVGSDEDPLDDLYGALAIFLMQVAAAGYTEPVRDKSGNILSYNIHIEQVGLYIRDTYEFIDDYWKPSQPLGLWNFKGVKRDKGEYIWDSIIGSSVALERDYEYVWPGDTLREDKYYRVNNQSFNDYRKKFKKGGDFVIYSDVKWYADKKLSWSVQP